MTQMEAEFIAREMRARCLHSSWSDLVGFWGNIISKLQDAYLTTVQHTTFFDHVSSSSFREMQTTVRDKLAQALALLAGESQVAKWEAEARGKLPQARSKG